jgi:D-serine dehydratase
MNISEILESVVDDRIKGVPGGVEPFPLGDIGRKGWNLLREDLPFPVAVIKESALEHNSRWMRAFLDRTGAHLCPHGKTTMSPQLFKRQLDDGAWGITASTASQLQVYRRYGVRRVFFANELVGAQNIRYVLDELVRDPEFDFYCLVDSTDGVELLANAVRTRQLERPLQVLVEGGYPSGRTGVRDVSTALDVARAVHHAGPALSLRGVEGFEGILMITATAESREELVTGFLDFLVEIAQRCESEGLFSEGPVILSAGGSAFFDLVADRFSHAGLKGETLVVLRSGCYFTHDSSLYTDLVTELVDRSPTARSIGPAFKPALEVWSYVQSRPEPGCAMLTMGKRDCSYDLRLPTPLAWFRPHHDTALRPLGAEYSVTSLNDQHAYLSVPEDTPLAVGDMVACGISHPCTTFDRWQLLFMVDDQYDVTSAVRTFF